MSAGANKVMVLGYLTKDPEKRVTPSGLSICKTVLAINSQYKNKSGEIVKDCEFIGVTWFGKQAENVAQYLKKGSLIMAEGKLKHEEWTDKNTGEKKRKLEVYGEMATFCSNPVTKEPLGTNPDTMQTGADEEIPF